MKRDIKVGDVVKLWRGAGSVEYEVRELRTERDAGGEPYAMASLSNGARSIGAFVETTRLVFVREGGL